MIIATLTHCTVFFGDNSPACCRPLCLRANATNVFCEWRAHTKSKGDSFIPTLLHSNTGSVNRMSCRKWCSLFHGET